MQTKEDNLVVFGTYPQINWGRRVGLIGLLVLIQSLLIGPPPASAATLVSVRDGNWSSARTWEGGRVPGALDAVQVRHNVRLDSDATVAGVTIDRGAKLLFPPRSSRELTSTGNVIVFGTLQMRPASASRLHRLVFSGIDESRFVGGGQDPLPTDVGLWVRARGRLAAVGTAKTSWTRATASIPEGATSFDVSSATGWRPGDEIVLGPTGPTEGREAFEVLKIADVDTTSGRVRLTSPTARAHVVVRLPNDTTMRPEVLNVTRNVRIEGTPLGRSHIHIHGAGVQTIRHVALRHLGVPIEGEPDSGRYALHFHHSHHRTHGTRVVGVVARDIGTHSFVAHGSHGITFSRTVAYDFGASAYWWDRLEADGSVALTHDTTFRNCVAASGVGVGIVHMFGLDNTMDGCVTYGIDPTRHESGRGFLWPAVPTNQEPFEGIHALWTWRDGIAHNMMNPIRTWQNTAEAHDVVRPILYWPTPPGGRTTAGLTHGAYRNSYHYINGVIMGDLPFEVHASSGLNQGTRRQEHRSMVYDANGGAHAILIARHNLGGTAPAVISNCQILGYTDAAVVVDEHTFDGDSSGGDFTFRNCTTRGGSALEPSDFEIRDLHSDSEICIQNDDDAWLIDGRGSVYTTTPTASCR